MFNKHIYFDFYSNDDPTYVCYLYINSGNKPVTTDLSIFMKWVGMAYRYTAVGFVLGEYYPARVC